MTAINGLRQQDWAVYDESGQLIQAEAGTGAVLPYADQTAFNESSWSGFGAALHDAALAPGLSMQEAATAGAALAQQSGDQAIASNTASPTPTEAPQETSSAEPPMHIAIPNNPPPRERSADEWERITATWNNRANDAYRLYQRMDEYGWDVADLAYVSGESPQAIGDYLTSIGALAGFGGEVTIGRDTVEKAYTDAVAAAQAVCPTEPNGSPGWVGDLHWDESGTAGYSYSMYFRLDFFTEWYLSQDTPLVRQFIRLHGSTFNASVAEGKVTFLGSGASMTTAHYDESGTWIPAELTSTVDPRITAYQSFDELNEVQRLAIWMDVDTPLNREILRVFGTPPEGASAVLPENDVGERMRARYGTELATHLMRLDAATKAMLANYVKAVNDAASQGPLPGTDPQSVLPWWKPGSPQYDEAGNVSYSYTFSGSAFHQWFVAQDGELNRLIGQAYGAGALPNYSYNESGAASEIQYTTAGQIEHLNIGFTLDENGRPTAADNTLSSAGMVAVDINYPRPMWDNGLVIYAPLQGFVTSEENIRHDPDFMEEAAPIIFVAFFSWLTAGMGTAFAQGMGMTTTVGGTTLTAAGAMVAGGITGAATSLVSSALSGDLSFKEILKGALAGALTAGLMRQLGELSQLEGFSDLLPQNAFAPGTPGGVIGRATVQGAVQALMGGSFRNGMIAGFASGLSEALVSRINEDVAAALCNGTMTQAEARSASYFANLMGAAVRTVASGPDTPGYAFANSLLQSTFDDTLPQPSASTPTQSSAAEDADAAAAPAPTLSTDTSTSGSGSQNADASAPTPASETQAAPAPAPPQTSGSESASSNAGADSNNASAPAGSPESDIAAPDANGDSTQTNDTDSSGSSGVSIGIKEGFYNNNGEFVSTVGAPVGKVSIADDDLLPPIPNALLPQGATSEDVFTARDDQGNRYYLILGIEGVFDPDVFARQIVDLGVDGLENGSVTPSQYLEASRQLRVNTAPAFLSDSQSNAVGDPEQAQLREQLLRQELRGQNITPLDVNTFVGPLTQQQAEVLQQTHLLLNSDDAARFTQLNGQGQFLAMSGVPVLAVPGSALSVDGALTWMAGGRVAIGAVADAALPLALMLFPSSLGTTPTVTQLTDTQRFVLHPGSEIRGNLEVLGADGTWRVEATNVQLAMQGDRRVALTDEEIREMYRPSVNPIVTPPPSSPPPSNVPPGDPQPNTMPGQPIDSPAPPDVEVLPAEPASWQDYLIHNSDGSVTRTRIPRTNGNWTGIPGESDWYSTRPEVNAVTNGSPINFEQGRPDFSPWSRGQITFEAGVLDGTDADFSKVNQALAQQLGLPNAAAAEQYLKEHGLTAHHYSDTVIQLIPRALHGNIPHIGSASDLRNRR